MAGRADEPVRHARERQRRPGNRTPALAPGYVARTGSSSTRQRVPVPAPRRGVPDIDTRETRRERSMSSRASAGTGLVAAWTLWSLLLASPEDGGRPVADRGRPNPGSRPQRGAGRHPSSHRFRHRQRGGGGSRGRADQPSCRERRCGASGDLGPHGRHEGGPPALEFARTGPGRARSGRSGAARGAARHHAPADGRNRMGRGVSGHRGCDHRGDVAADDIDAGRDRPIVPGALGCQGWREESWTRFSTMRRSTRATAEGRSSPTAGWWSA